MQRERPTEEHHVFKGGTVALVRVRLGLWWPAVVLSRAKVEDSDLSRGKKASGAYRAVRYFNAGPNSSQWDKYFSVNDMALYSKKFHLVRPARESGQNRALIQALTEANRIIRRHGTPDEQNALRSEEYNGFWSKLTGNRTAPAARPRPAARPAPMTDDVVWVRVENQLWWPATIMSRSVLYDICKKNNIRADRSLRALCYVGVRDRVRFWPNIVDLSELVHFADGMHLVAKASAHEKNELLQACIWCEDFIKRNNAAQKRRAPSPEPVPPAQAKRRRSPEEPAAHPDPVARDAHDRERLLQACKETEDRIRNRNHLQRKEQNASTGATNIPTGPPGEAPSATRRIADGPRTEPPETVRRNVERTVESCSLLDTSGLLSSLSHCASGLRSISSLTSALEDQIRSLTRRKAALRVQLDEAKRRNTHIENENLELQKKERAFLQAEANVVTLGIEQKGQHTGILGSISAKQKQLSVLQHEQIQFERKIAEGGAVKSQLERSFFLLQRDKEELLALLDATKANAPIILD